MGYFGQRIRSHFLACALLAVTSGAFCEFPTLRLVPVSEGELVAPVAIRHAGDGSERLFVVDQRGIVQIIESGVVLATPFLDIESKLIPQRTNFDERGMLGIAFHPAFGTTGQPGSGKFYVYYSAPSPNAPGTVQDPVDHMSVVSEFTVSGDPNVADDTSERILLTFDQPQFNHDGGDLAFGPIDGLLYISAGDGGGSNDNRAGHTGGDASQPDGALGNAQDTSKLLGKILRIDPLANDGPGGEYGIPQTNPFVGVIGAREEIFAYGLRNPWRIYFDTGPGGSNELFVADVGQGDIEEVNIVAIGDNMGWRNREGSFVFDANASGTGPFVDPLVEYAHPGTNIGGLPQIGLSVIGGCFYRGSRFPNLQGKYIFGDWSDSFSTPNGTLLGMEETSPGNFSLSVPNVESGNPLGKYITAFGTDESGEIYVATRQQLAPEKDPATMMPTGAIYRVEPTEVTLEFEPVQDNSIFSEGTLSNGAGEWLFSGLTNNIAERRALLKFDVESQLPRGTMITDVTLQLEMDKTISGSIDYDLFRLSRSWGEGESDAPAQEGAGTAALAGDATWIHAIHDSESWATPGGDFEVVVSASTSVAGNGPYQWTSTRLTQDVQEWVNGDEINEGWILLTADTSIGNAKRFKSRESAAVAERPKLMVTYAVELPPITPPSLRKTFQPDGSIQGKRGRVRGDNIYNLSGAGQGLRLKGTTRTRFQYFVFGQNDGNVTDSIGVSGSRKNRFFKVAYALRSGVGFANVTGAVSSGTLSLPSLAPSQRAQLRATIKATRKARDRGKSIKTFCRFQSLSSPGSQDRVVAKIIAKKK